MQRPSAARMPASSVFGTACRYEPALEALDSKYHAAMKEKALIMLQRDKYVCCAEKGSTAHGGAPACCTRRGFGRASALRGETKAAGSTARLGSERCAGPVCDLPLLSRAAAGVCTAVG